MHASVCTTPCDPPPSAPPAPSRTYASGASVSGHRLLPTLGWLALPTTTSLQARVTADSLLPENTSTFQLGSPPKAAPLLDPLQTT